VTRQADDRQATGANAPFDTAAGGLPPEVPELRADTALVDNLHPSPNIEPRKNAASPSLLILHYTGLASVERAIDWLSRPESKVSCHYVIDEAGRVTQMVPERLRAWQAGVSHWKGETDINSHSIGIEIHNPGHDLGYPKFPNSQMQSVRALSLDIMTRWSIRPEGVLAHSDIAPARKMDPGEKFDWAWLAASGVGHWVEPEPVDEDDPGLSPGISAAEVEQVQRALARYGYGIEPTGVADAATHTVVAAFQRHFRPARVDGRIDRSTRTTLYRLLAALPAEDGDKRDAPTA